MTVLAIETATEVCSVAISHEGIVTEATRILSRTHNEVVLGLVEQVMEEAAVSPQALTCVAFGAGPGSFTGVRIAAALTQALALAASARVAPVPSMLALAHAAGCVLESGLAVDVVTAIQSRRQAAYVAAWRCAGAIPEQHTPDGAPGRASRCATRRSAGG